MWRKHFVQRREPFKRDCRDKRNGKGYLVLV